MFATFFAVWITRGWYIALACGLILGLDVETVSAAQPVRTLQGRHCAADAPAGWAFTGESPNRIGFGADLVAPDHGTGASYLVVAVPPDLVGGRQFGGTFADPHQAAVMVLGRFGARLLRCGHPEQPAPGAYLMHCRDPEFEGLTLYRSTPMPAGGYVLVMRTAVTRVGEWSGCGALAAAAARSIRCHVPTVPAAADPPLPRPKTARRKPGGAQADSGVDRWLVMEHFHDPRTGENVWVSPSSDWRDRGPQGPGYYIRRGQDWVKLAPGRQ